MNGIEHPWRFAEETPDATAVIISDTGQSQSYGEMMDGANRLSHWFIRNGLKEGDTIAIFLENNVRYFEVCWAAKNAGLFYVCLPRLATLADAAYIVGDCGAKVLISSYAQRSVAVELADRTSVPHRLMMDGVAGSFTSYEETIAQEPAERPAERRRGGSLLYSSGTTGRPKGVVSPLADVGPEVPPIRHSMLVDQYAYAPDTRLLVGGPFYHTSGLRFSMHVHRVGGCVIGLSKFDAAETLRAIDVHRATMALLVPTMFVRMLKLPEAVRTAYDTSSLRYALHQAAPCPIPVKEAMLAWWGPIIYEMYGGTEGAGQTVITPQEWIAHKGSVGRPPRGVSLHIVDGNGVEVGPHVDGLIYLSNGRRFEYLNDAEKTRAAHHPEGWATLGDIGHVDEEGYLYLTDRQSNMIISGGVNIYPQEAENLLVAHPAVADVAVIGVPNPEFGEEVKALVVPQDGLAAIDPAALEAELIAFCRAELSRIKCPRSVDFVDSLPRSEAGKLLKKQLRDAYQARAAAPSPS